MRKQCFFFLCFFIPLISFAQGKFKIELDAPSFINDKLLITPPSMRKGFEDFYYYLLDTSKNITDFGKKFGFKQSAFQITIQEKNVLEGYCNYTIPLSFQYFNRKTKQIYKTSTFFLDSGIYKIQLPEMFNRYEIAINSPLNIEYSSFKKIFSDLYVQRKDVLFDSLLDLEKKEEKIASYIKRNPNSFIAFWEIVDDYTQCDYNPIYLKNLQLFSIDIKSTDLFKKFENKLKSEDSTLVGRKFPTINLDRQNALNIESFKKYKLTVIDYWSTTCAPCIRAMPQLVALYNKYKLKGVNFITVTAESEPSRIKLAKTILVKNNVKWINYFDTKNNFRNKVNATAYPLQFLVDQNGKILARVSGNLKKIEKLINSFIE